MMTIVRGQNLSSLHIAAQGTVTLSTDYILNSVSSLPQLTDLTLGYHSWNYMSEVLVLRSILSFEPIAPNTYHPLQVTVTKHMFCLGYTDADNWTFLRFRQPGNPPKISTIHQCKGPRNVQKPILRDSPDNMAPHYLDNLWGRMGPATPISDQTTTSPRRQTKNLRLPDL
ncbi:hypothetical protein C8J56DRAFT_1166800 [Mycena floridula]|nr:hypothetical protein C8J56DRAFT_1166800 [Mycena floridula]